jgi:hypothetical protein
MLQMASLVIREKRGFPSGMTNKQTNERTNERSYA